MYPLTSTCANIDRNILIAHIEKFAVSALLAAYILLISILLPPLQ